MRFVFFDTETTGTSVVFDQILHFAAALTDETFNVLDSFEVRCRRLPWIVPAPAAMVLTGVTPHEIDDPGRPTHTEFSRQVHQKLRSWSPAIFIGYNSARFDEPLLQRAFWQALLPPYLTVTGGNSRLDILLVARAIEVLKSNALEWHRDERGRPSFKLDQIAPHFGFDYSNAHDALADVHATIFVAKTLANASTDLWRTFLSRTTKKEVDRAYGSHEPILFPERVGGNARFWWGQRIDPPGSGRQAVFADLTIGWPELVASTEAERTYAPLTDYVRLVALNRAPPALTQSEANKLLGITPGAGIKSNSEFLQTWPGIVELLRQAVADDVKEIERPRELEEMIFDGFANAHDEALMASFHTAAPVERATIAASFEDNRFRALANRIVFVEDAQYLAPEDRRRIQQGIAKRLNLEISFDETAWRTISKARAELAQLREIQKAPADRLDEIEVWLGRLGAVT